MIFSFHVSFLESKFFLLNTLLWWIRGEECDIFSHVWDQIASILTLIFFKKKPYPKIGSVPWRGEQSIYRLDHSGVASGKSGR